MRQQAQQNARLANQLRQKQRAGGKYVDVPKFVKSERQGRIGNAAKGNVRALTETLGTQLGNYMMPGVGGLVGGGAGYILGKVIGAGSYKVQRNSLVNGPSSSQVPMVHGDGVATRVKHREFIRDVNMTSVFTNNTFVIDPTNSTTFPWLAQISHSFQEYEIFGMIFHYRNTASVTSTGAPGMGSITMALKYDPYEPEPVSKSELANCLFAVSAKPCEDAEAPVECKRSQTSLPRLRIRSGGIEDEDRRFFEFGNFFLSTVGAPAPYTGAGELWVTYDIGLYKPKIDPDALLVSTYTAHLQTTAALDLQPFKDGVFLYNSIGVALGDAGFGAGSSIVFPKTLPAGTYACSYIPAISAERNPTSIYGDYAFANGLAEQKLLIGTVGQHKLKGTLGAMEGANICLFSYDGTGSDVAPPTLTMVGVGIDANADWLVWRLPNDLASSLVRTTESRLHILEEKLQRLVVRPPPLDVKDDGWVRPTPKRK